MSIVLHPLKTISEIESEFHEHYPYLRIVFFPGKGKKHDVLMDDLTLANLCNEWNGKQILIHPFHSVKEVELIFAKQLKVAVQVERKQKEGWVETRRSYYLSLDTHNEMGRLSAQVPVSFIQ